MNPKNEPDGVFTAAGRATDESLRIASAIRSGRLTRHDFQAWYEKRHAEGLGIVLALREKASVIAEPIEMALAQGRDIFRSTADHPSRRRRTTRTASKHAGSGASRRARTK